MGKGWAGLDVAQKEIIDSIERYNEQIVLSFCGLEPVVIFSHSLANYVWPVGELDHRFLPSVESPNVYKFGSC